MQTSATTMKISRSSVWATVGEVVQESCVRLKSNRKMIVRLKSNPQRIESWRVVPSLWVRLQPGGIVRAKSNPQQPGSWRILPSLWVRLRPDSLVRLKSNPQKPGSWRVVPSLWVRLQPDSVVRLRSNPQGNTPHSPQAREDLVSPRGVKHAFYLIALLTTWLTHLPRWERLATCKHKSIS